MARIPDDQIERLKHEIALQRLAEGMGIVLKPCNQELRGLCPFHEDHAPSLFFRVRHDFARRLYHKPGNRAALTRSESFRG